MCAAPVVVQSNANVPPLDEETILFLQDRVVLGKVRKFSLHCTTPLSVVSNCLLSDNKMLQEFLTQHLKNSVSLLGSDNN